MLPLRLSSNSKNFRNEASCLDAFCNPARILGPRRTRWIKGHFGATQKEKGPFRKSSHVRRSAAAFVMTPPKNNGALLRERALIIRGHLRINVDKKYTDHPFGVSNQRGLSVYVFRNYVFRFDTFNIFVRERIETFEYVFSMWSSFFN